MDEASSQHRSESDVLEVALDRMYREEIRFNQFLREGSRPEDQYQIGKGNEGENENHMDNS